MASLRGAIAAAAGASSRRGSALVCPRGGAGVAILSPRGGAGVPLLSPRCGAGVPLLSRRGGAGGRLALLSPRGGAAVPFSGARGLSTGSSNGQGSFWTWIRAKADEIHQTVYTTHAVVYMLCTSTACYAVYYVDGAVGKERRIREGFERVAVQKHQELAEHMIKSMEELKEKMGHFWDRYLAYREDDLQCREAVTKSADLLKKKGYVVLPAADLDEIKSQIAELKENIVLPAADLDEIKSQIADLKEKVALLPILHENQPDSGKEQEPADGGVSDFAVKDSTDSGKSVPGGAGGV